MPYKSEMDLDEEMIRKRLRERERLKKQTNADDVLLPIQSKEQQMLTTREQEREKERKSLDEENKQIAKEFPGSAMDPELFEVVRAFFKRRMKK